MIGDEDLLRIPNSSPATVVALPTAGPMPPSDAEGLAVPVSHPDPATWKIVVRSKVTTLLRLRLTDVPGWHGTIDGRSLPVGRFAGVMLQARLSTTGSHTVVLRYEPTAFAVGVGLALATVVTLALALVIGRTRRRVVSDRPADVAGRP